MTNNDALIEALREWQRNEDVHPMTCIVDSTHQLLEPFDGPDVMMRCPTCGDISRPPRLTFFECKEAQR